MSLRGHAVHFNTERGFGKIRGDNRREYFVHRDDLSDVLSLKPGQQVEFDPTESLRGPRATDVRLIEAAGRELCPLPSDLAEEAR